MRVLFFTENTHRGGLDTYLVNLIQAWPRAEDEIWVLANASHPGLSDLQARLGGRAHVAPHGAPAYVDRVIGAQGQRSWLTRCLAPLVRLRLLASGYARLRREFAECAAERLMIVCGGYPGGDTCLAALLAWSSVPGRSAPVMNVHNLARGAPVWNAVARIWERWLDRKMVHGTRAFVAVSAACARSFQVRPAIWADALVAYIHNGVACGSPHSSESGLAGDEGQPERARIRARMGVAPDAPLCIMLATYEARKGHEMLFAAFQKVRSELPDAHLLICGFGTDAEFETVCAQRCARGLDQAVTLERFRADALQLLAASDVLAVPSQGFESFGLVCLEAMLAGVPVVATNVGGLPEVVEDGETGYVVPPRDPTAFAERLLRILANRDLGSRLGRAGRERALSRFSVRRMAAQYADLLIEGKLPDSGRVN